MGALMRSMDWSKTPLGAVESWPQSLRTSVSTCLNSRSPIMICWGPELVELYNDACRPILASKHPKALGGRVREVWPEIWPIIGPMLAGVLTRGEATWSENILLPLERREFAEECYFTFSYSPIRDESGGIGGVFTAVTETTQQVIGERRLRMLRELAARTSGIIDEQAVLAAAQDVLDRNDNDLTFSLLCLLDPRDGVHKPMRALPAALDLDCSLIAEVADSGIARLTKGLRVTSAPPGTPSANAALVLPLALPGQSVCAGMLVAGLSPRLVFDDSYRGFLGLAASQIAAALANARAFADAQRRADALAELARAKTAYFSNVSHEFRTPLTLMLGPLEELMRAGANVGGAERSRLALVHRNGLRLLKLVNTLLDFSRIEAGRMQASYDLWEKIVLNLVSNAFKFTLHGEVTVSLRDAGDHVELTVADSGSGISAADLPRIFERFHRVHGVACRTQEGSGIGLAFVQELVKLHGGAVRAESVLGAGSRFIVTIPFGKDHLSDGRIAVQETALPRSVSGTKPFVQEALSWTGAPADFEMAVAGSFPPPPAAKSRRERVLVADDNVDMRDYLQRLLGSRWEVELVADGRAALDAARKRIPDLVLSDVLMPGEDGFALLRELRAADDTASVPVILLSARASEEAQIEGRAAGADDYLVKPFSARELVSRIESQLALAKRRKLDQKRLAEFKGDASGRRERQVIERQVAHLSRLVNDLLDVSRIAQGKIELSRRTVDIAEVAAMAVETASPLFESKSHRLAIEVPREQLYVYGDPVRLAQILGNLLTNAAKYTPAQGHIDLSASEENGEVVIRVNDDGIGITPDFLPKVFDLFVQNRQALDRAEGGLGLGLSVVKSLVTLHGGSVSAKSGGPGRGSEFIVRLPALHPGEHDRPPQRAVEKRKAAAVSPRRILVVDDNVDAAESIAEYLASFGHEVVIAHDGPQALSVQAVFHADIGVLDLGLPVMDGYELAVKLRQTLTSPVRLIALTGYGQEEDRARSRRAGFDAHLVKPIEIEELCEFIATLQIAPISGGAT